MILDTLLIIGAIKRFKNVIIIGLILTSLAILGLIIFAIYSVLMANVGFVILFFAVAGFKQEHIDIEVKDHVLTIKGDRPARRDQDKYVHKGISARNWRKSFRLSEYTEVTGADLVDGILTVKLEVVLPKEKQPRKINIGTNEETNDNNSAELLQERA